MRGLFLIPLCALSLTGCVLGHWPAERGGGMAEVAPPERHQVLLHPTHQHQARLLDRLMLMEASLERLVAQGAEDYMRAETTLARKLTFRIRREIAGGLDGEAERDLIRLRDRLQLIDRKINGVLHRENPQTL